MGTFRDADPEVTSFGKAALGRVILAVEIARDSLEADDPELVITALADAQTGVELLSDYLTDVLVHVKFKLTLDAETDNISTVAQRDHDRYEQVVLARGGQRLEDMPTAPPVPRPEAAPEGLPPIIAELIQQLGGAGLVINVSHLTQEEEGPSDSDVASTINLLLGGENTIG